MTHHSILALVMLSLGCSTTYVATTPKVVSGQAANVAVDAADFGATRIIEIFMRVGAQEGTELRLARLNAAQSKPCKGGRDFVVIYKDGTVEHTGPLAVAGSHRLRMSFVVEDEPIDAQFELDLEFQKRGKLECIRVPLYGATFAAEGTP